MNIPAKVPDNNVINIIMKAITKIIISHLTSKSNNWRNIPISIVKKIVVIKHIIILNIIKAIIIPPILLYHNHI